MACDLKCSLFMNTSLFRIKKEEFCSSISLYNCPPYPYVSFNPFQDLASRIMLHASSILPLMEMETRFKLPSSNQELGFGFGELGTEAIAGDMLCEFLDSLPTFGLCESFVRKS